MSQGALQKNGQRSGSGHPGWGGSLWSRPRGGPEYTRNGAFQVSSKGQLVTAAGDPVVGDRGAITMLARSCFDQRGRDHLVQRRGDGQAEACRLSGGYRIE